jgi:hypothetical protein
MTSSRVPCLVLPPELRPRWMPSPLSLAQHMLGIVAIEAEGKVLRRGKLLEPVGKVLLAEDFGIELVAEQVRYELPDLPAACHVDGVIRPDGEDVLVEMKSMPDRVYPEQWADGPPLHVVVQVQFQLALAEVERAIVMPITVDYAGGFEVPQLHELRYDQSIIDLLLTTSREFLNMLRAGELPAPDETVASYEAIMRTLKIQAQKTVVLNDERSAEMFRDWQVDRRRLRAGETGDEAAKRYFAARVGDAAVVELPGVGRIERKQVVVPAEKVLRAAYTKTQWNLKEQATR